MYARPPRHTAGFTVPELVAALVGLFILLAVAGFILRPQNHQQARYEAEQRLHMATIMQAINKYQAANNGALPEGISEQFAFVGTQEGQVDLCKVLVPTHLKDMPLDRYTGAKAYSPANQNDYVSDKENARPCSSPNMIYMTGYAIAKDKEGRVQLAVLAPDQKTPVLILSQK